MATILTDEELPFYCWACGWAPRAGYDVMDGCENCFSRLVYNDPGVAHLTDAELTKPPYPGMSAAEFRAISTAFHYRALARKMARAFLSPGFTVQARIEVIRGLTVRDGALTDAGRLAAEILGLPRPCTLEQFEAALREEEADRG